MAHLPGAALKMSQVLVAREAFSTDWGHNPVRSSIRSGCNSVQGCIACFMREQVRQPSALDSNAQTKRLHHVRRPQQLDKHFAGQTDAERSIVHWQHATSANTARWTARHTRATSLAAVRAQLRSVCQSINHAPTRYTKRVYGERCTLCTAATSVHKEFRFCTFDPIRVLLAVPVRPCCVYGREDPSVNDD